MVVSIIPDRIRRMVSQKEKFLRGFRNATVISVCAQKGGVGKTTTAVNLAVAMAAFYQQKVLLLDMDSQGHVASSLLSELCSAASCRISDILLGKRRDLMEIAVPTDIENLWVTPSDKDLNETEGLISTRIGKEFLLRGVIKTARTHFDIVIIDCPPNLGNLTLNALLASDRVLVPCDMSILSLEGVHDLLETLETIEDRLGHHLEMLGLLRTRVDKRNKRVNRNILKIMHEEYGEVLLNTEIPISTALSKSQMAGKPVFNHEPASAGATAYLELAGEISRRLDMPLA